MDNFYLVLILFLIALAFAILISVAKYNTTLKSIIIKAILIAENECNTTIGEERLELATRYVYSKLPMVIKKYISQDLLLSLLKNLIQKIFDEIKCVLDYSKPSKGE